MKRDWPALGAILVLAFVLRLAGLGFGLPYLYHQDEPMMVNHAMAIGAAGDWNTHYFVIPPFVSYFLLVLYGITFLLGHALGIFKDKTDFALLFLRDPSLFYFLGRLFIGALFGTATVWLTARMGERFFSKRIGLLAGLFLAVSLIHVQYSHYIYADAPVTFAITLLVFYHLKQLRAPSLRNFLLMGVILGWAASIKYTALYFVPTTVVTYFLIFGRRAWAWSSIQNIALAGIASLLTFALLAPYTFLDWGNFYRTFLHQSGAQGYVGIGHYFTYSILNGTSVLFVIFCLVGIFISFKRWPKEAVVLAVFVTVFYGVNSWAGQKFSRYILPAIPVLCLWAAAGFDEACQMLKKRAFLIKALGGVLFLSLFLPSAYGDALFMRKDTRTLCAEWFHQNVKEGSVVVVDNRAFGPPLSQTKDQIEEKYAFLGEAGQDSVKKQRLDLMRQAIEHKKTYNVFTLSKDGNEGGSEFLFLKPAVKPDWDELQKIGADYLVINYSEIVEEYHGFKGSIRDHVELVASFSPYRRKDLKVPVDPYASTAAPHLPSELFRRHSLGPYLEIYRIKK